MERTVEMFIKQVEEEVHDVLVEAALFAMPRDKERSMLALSVKDKLKDMDTEDIEKLMGACGYKKIVDDFSHMFRENGYVYFTDSMHFNHDIFCNKWTGELLNKVIKDLVKYRQESMNRPAWERGW